MILTSKTVCELETPENLISCPEGMYVPLDRICRKTILSALEPDLNHPLIT